MENVDVHEDQVLILPAGQFAYDMYVRVALYACPVGHPFLSGPAPQRLGFYSAGIRREIARVHAVIDVRVSQVAAVKAAIEAAGHDVDAVEEALLEWAAWGRSRRDDYTYEHARVALLSAARDLDTVVLREAIAPARGRGKGMQGKALFALEDLVRAETVDELRALRDARAAEAEHGSAAAGGDSKQATYDAIHDALGRPRRLLAPGGTPHSETIDAAAIALDVPLLPEDDKVARARQVVETTGGTWKAGVHDSTTSASGGGGNITVQGLSALLEALRGGSREVLLPTGLEALEEGYRLLESDASSTGRPCVPAPVVSGTTEHRLRSPRVVAAVLAFAGGICESCGERGPFEHVAGSRMLPFLEVHHVVPLAQDGSDRVENAVAVCPNCHRALHHASDRDQRRERLYARVARLEREEPGSRS